MRFDEKSFRSSLARAFDLNKISGLLTKEASDRLVLLTEILLCENEKYNLTAITEPSEIALSHYADSALLSSYIKGGARVCDVGCGAGFPTLPLAILRPDLTFLAVDSTAKRIAYVENTARELGLTNVGAVCARAEELSLTDRRESFDYVTARAVAALPVLTELCLPLVKVGGQFLAMKGRNAKFELTESKRAIATLGGRLNRLDELTLVGGAEDALHPVIVVDKVTKCPDKYPRAYAKIVKSHL